MITSITFRLAFDSIYYFSHSYYNKEITEKGPHFPVHYEPVPKWFSLIFLLYTIFYFLLEKPTLNIKFICKIFGLIIN